MASASAAPPNPDAMVTLKVNFDGSTRKCKLPLRDMGANTLEDKLRVFLNIPPTADCVFERYSDSAAAYVVLDRANVSVYKQLYRAAKAKSKLKLRVKLNEVPEEEEQAVSEPLPATVESEPEPKYITLGDAVTVYPSTTTLAPSVEAAQETSTPSSRPTSVSEPQEAQRPAPEQEMDMPASVFPASGATFAVCCNSCDQTIPNAHYHCSTCDDGDFDLCQACVDQGITCYGPDHWLIKRSMKNGIIVYSITETIEPKTKPKSKASETDKVDHTPAVAPLAEQLRQAERIVPIMDVIPSYNRYLLRTCNCCVQDFTEDKCLHCTACEDFDLCMDCFAKDSHGHHPKHGFVPALEGAHVPDHITVKLNPGRNQMHNAICDGCDKFITGVRHKCLDCPDWDYCADCVINAKFVHANHRFVPVYEPLGEHRSRGTNSIHYGICCDGPLCSSEQRSLNSPTYITGIRYKCAVCHDTDFCASCEANPANTHNKTHPLIKFKTPVRRVSVTTHGEDTDGHKMQPMGDRQSHATCSRSTGAARTKCSMNRPRTVVDAQPTEVKTPAVQTSTAVSSPAPVAPAAPLALAEAPKPGSMSATFLRDTVTDGTVLAPNFVFEQTWVLRNTGTTAWPAGCSVRFVGGDYMGHVDPTHPAGISELVSASESTKCYAGVAPGQEFGFTVLLRTPVREGRSVSYWRLTTADGDKFGDRLWCEVLVKPTKSEAVQPTPASKPEPVVEKAAVADDEEALKTSTMIFPKLEKESPVASIHEEARSEPAASTAVEVKDEFEQCDVLDEDWDESEDGFMTDEEYDILDASDEEFLESQQKKH